MEKKILIKNLDLEEVKKEINEFPIKHTIRLHEGNNGGYRTVKFAENIDDFLSKITKYENTYITVKVILMKWNEKTQKYEDETKATVIYSKNFFGGFVRYLEVEAE